MSAQLGTEDWSSWKTVLPWYCPPVGDWHRDNRARHLHSHLSGLVLGLHNFSYQQRLCRVPCLLSVYYRLMFRKKGTIEGRQLACFKH